ncbi:MAG: DUF1963 domain-containing protein [Treponema sp.]|nr:DUF1963 domain-containing protein [Treponema sp.]
MRQKLFNPKLLFGGRIFSKAAQNQKLPLCNRRRHLALKRYIKEHACKPALLLHPKPDAAPGLTSSKIGGIPYWPSAKEYPTDEGGKKMHLLCQLNLSECKESCGSKKRICRKPHP